MASVMTEFCEQMDPEILLEIKQAPHEAQRVQESFVAATEKQALLWLAAQTPGWVGPDHLTLLGFAAQTLQLDARRCDSDAVFIRYGDRELRHGDVLRPDTL
jgi:hypothetical protein